MSGTVAVTGAAGKTGRAVVAALAARGIEARALVHTAAQAEAGVPGAIANVAVDLNDADQVGQALTGTEAVYLIAPNMHQDESALLENVISFCESYGGASGPSSVVYHSVIHPYLPQMPHHMGKAAVEARLHASGLNWSILQPASYFDNVLGVWDSIRGGTWPLPYSMYSPFTPIALADVADAAAVMVGDMISEEPRYHWATFEIAGPEKLTTEQMAEQAADVLGHPVTVKVDSSPIAGRPPVLQAMFNYYDNYGICGNSRILVDLLAKLGRTPTTWRQWVAQQ